MSFNSFSFLMIFLPLCLIGRYILPRFCKLLVCKWFIIVCSVVFYGIFDPFSLVLFAVSILITYLCSYFYSKTDKKFFAFTGIVFDALFLILFKSPILSFVSFLGISFISFSEISFLADRLKGICDHPLLSDFVFYITFFPKILSGPIVKYKNLVSQIHVLEQTFVQAALVKKGIIKFVLGLSKKVLLADNFAMIVGSGFSHLEALDTPAAVLVIISYTLQLYFDFSGYSDMAIGIGYLLGFELPENFISPYKSVSIKEFWNRWHITLGKFFTDYIYIPLGGSRKGKFRKCVNILIVFLASGIWHGFGLNFILWGLLNGIFVILSFIPEKLSAKNSFLKICCRVVTFLLFTFSLIPFRAANLTDAAIFIKRLFSGEHYHAFALIASEVNFAETYLIYDVFHFSYQNMAYVLILFILLGLFIVNFRDSYEIANKKKMGKAFAFFLAFVFVWSIISFGNVTEFVYFNF